MDILMGIFRNFGNAIIKSYNQRWLLLVMYVCIVVEFTCLYLINQNCTIYSSGFPMSRTLVAGFIARMTYLFEISNERHLSTNGTFFNEGLWNPLSEKFCEMIQCI